MTITNTTIAQVAKKVVEESIDYDYIMDFEQEKGPACLRDVYDSEYGYNGSSPKACMDYLQGLPSVCTVPFSNFEILALLEECELVKLFPKEDVIEKYWQECGNAFYQLIKA